MTDRQTGRGGRLRALAEFLVVGFPATYPDGPLNERLAALRKEQVAAVAAEFPEDSEVTRRARVEERMKLLLAPKSDYMQKHTARRMQGMESVTGRISLLLVVAVFAEGGALSRPREFLFAKFAVALITIALVVLLVALKSALKVWRRRRKDAGLVALELTPEAELMDERNGKNIITSETDKIGRLSDLAIFCGLIPGVICLAINYIFAI